MPSLPLPWRPLRPLIATAVACFAGSWMDVASAETVTWCAAAGGYWDTGSNWCPAPPSATSDALLGSANTAFRSGTLNLQSFQGTGQLTLSGGTLGVEQASSIGSLVMTGGTLTGAGSVLITHSAVLTGGEMTGVGSSTFKGDVSLGSAAGVLLQRRTYNFEGATTAQGKVSITGLSVVNNKGTWQDLGSTAQSGLSYAGANFNNSGSYIKSGQSDSSLRAYLNNTGSLQIQAGQLELLEGATSTGQIDVAAGAVLSLSGGTGSSQYTLSGLQAGSGTGQIYVNGGGWISAENDNAFSGELSVFMGSVKTVGSLTVGRLKTNVASFSGGGVFTVKGASDIEALTVSGGSTHFNGDVALSTMNVTGGSVAFKGTTTFRNYADLTLGQGAKVVNAGTWLDNKSASRVGSNPDSGASFTNSGTFIRSAEGTTDLSTVQYINTGVTIVQKGLIKLPANFINTGTFQGNGRVETTLFTNSGKVAPGESAGTFSITGDFAQTADGQLDIELQSASLHDLLRVSGSAALGGKLAVSCLADCHVQIGDSILILDAAPDALTGVFSDVSYTGFGQLGFDLIYDRAHGDVFLRAVPEPDAWWLLLAGIGVVAARRRAGQARR